MVSRNSFESPNWKRPGTESYFAEARAAGYTRIEESTGEAFLPTPDGLGKLKAPKKNAPRVTVRVYLPHVDEMTDGAKGPIMDLTYKWTNPEPVPKPGCLVSCPPAPKGVRGPHLGVVIENRQEKITYAGPAKALLKSLGRSHPIIGTGFRSRVAIVAINESIEYDQSIGVLDKWEE